MRPQRSYRFLLFLLLHCFPFFSHAATDLRLPNATLSNLVLGSCHNDRKVKPHQPNIWNAIQQENPDVFVWMGDAVYPAQRKLANLTYMKQLFDNMLTNDTIGYRQFQTKYGIFGTWDDHDFGANDAGRETTQKMERAKLYTDHFLKLPDTTTTATPPRQGLYYSVTFGEPQQQVKLIFLDTRWHRARHCWPSVATYMPLGAGFAALTRWVLAGFHVNHWWPFWDCIHSPVLGGEQWAWLEQELETSLAAVHVVVSSIQVLTTNPTVESWGHFPAERQRLIQLLGKGISGLFLVSGDVHHAEILNPMRSVETASHKNSFLEVTSSGMTHYCSQPFYGRLCEPMLQHYNRNRHSKNENYYIGKNYGRLEIDWEQKQAEILVKNEVGETVLRTGPRKFQQHALAQDEIDRVVPCIDGHMIRPFLQIVVAISAVAVVVVRKLKAE
jgi:phosphodiesterase/alkaline phosphatase D-like protein